MDVYKSFHDFLRLFNGDFLVRLLLLLIIIITLGYLLGRRFKVRNFTVQAPTHRSKRVKSSDLNCGRFLGQGCSGIIFEATWSRGKHISPPKSLAARKAFPAVPADVFGYEADRLVELDHPNIVKVLGWTIDGRSCSLVMDFMKYDLFSVVQKRKEAMRNNAQVNFGSTVPIPLHEAVHIMLQIAKGMKYVHEQGLAHGDLKPNNVLVDSESGLMVVKVADFGLTETKKRSTTLVSHRTRCLQVLKWKAPELFEDLLGSSTEDSEDMWTEMFPYLEAVKTSPASSLVTMESAESKMQLADVYSFALTCSYVLGAQVPHDSNLGLRELRNGISSGARPQLPSECPNLLASLISECWDPIPSRRPAFIDICEEMEWVEMELEQSEDMAIARSEVELLTDTYWINYPDPITDEPQDLREKVEKLKALTEWGHFFFDFNESGLEINKKFAEEGFAAIYEGEWKRDDGKLHSVAIKVFKYREFTITEPVMHFFNSKGTEANPGTSRVLRPLGGTLLENGRLALVYERCWGDLRKLIDLQAQKKKVPPFKLEMAIDVMLQIAEGVVELHEFGLVHRDVKSSRVLVRDLEKFSTGGSHGVISCALTGYEASELVGGTFFWRAPEILDGFKMRTISAMEFTPPVDVYSFGMTCYEILTGKIPFENERPNDYDLVISGRRPELPASVHPQLRDLVERCWDANPLKRPTSQEIVLLLRNIQTGK